ncbi:MAG TPA: hypothetical protein VL307_10140 [Chitinophagaceae bacterium]|nr:hypothetical protein [Chitinophagaceae bacterium]
MRLSTTLLFNLGLLCIGSGMFVSCAGIRATRAENLVTRVEQQQADEQAAITKMEALKADRLQAGAIDSLIASKIQDRIDESKKKLTAPREMMDSLTAAIQDRKIFRKRYRSVFKTSILFLKNREEGFSKRIIHYGIVEDALNSARQSQYDLASFFGLGEYLIPADKRSEAARSFNPLIDSMLMFAGKYPSVPKSSTIVLKGYADGTSIVPYSTLYYRLANELKQDRPTDEDMNLALSKLRAASISEVISQLLVERQAALLQLHTVVKIELVQEGRGEEKPNAAISNYNEEDARRRIVLFFWSMLPEKI